MTENPKQNKKDRPQNDDESQVYQVADEQMPKELKPTPSRGDKFIWETGEIEIE